MYAKALSMGGMLLLAAGVILGTSEPVQAGRGGGGGHGSHGGHGGHSGFHRGGFYGYGFYPYYGYGYDPYYGYSDYPAVESYRSYYPSVDVMPSPETARVIVTVPPDAELWFNGVKMKTSGVTRRFETPPLGTGRSTYDARARWMENGQPKTQTQVIKVTPGTQVRVRFPMGSEE